MIDDKILKEIISKSIFALKEKEMGRIPAPKVIMPNMHRNHDGTIVYAAEAPYYMHQKALEACTTFNEYYHIGDIIQLWFEDSTWNSDFGIISKLAYAKEVDVNYTYSLEWHALFEVSLIGGSSDFRDKDGFRVCQITGSSKLRYKRVTLDEIIEFRREIWENSLKVAIQDYKMAKQNVRDYRRRLNHNESNLIRDLKEAKERYLKTNNDDG